MEVVWKKKIMINFPQNIFVAFDIPCIYMYISTRYIMHTAKTFAKFASYFADSFLCSFRQKILQIKNNQSYKLNTQKSNESNLKRKAKGIITVRT